MRSHPHIDLSSENEGKIRLLSVLSGLGRAVTESLDLGTLSERILSVLMSSFELDAAWLYSVRGSSLHVEAWETRETKGRICEDSPVRAVAAACAEAIRQGRPQLVEVPEGEGGVANARHLYVTPLLAKERVVACLCIARSDGPPFREDELELVATSAPHLGLAMEHMRIVVDERRRVRDLVRLNELGSLLARDLGMPALIDTAIEYLSDLVDGLEIYLLLLREDGQLHMVATNHPDPPLRDFRIEPDDARATILAIEADKPVIIRNPATNPMATSRLAKIFHHTQVAAIPLVAQDTPLGAFILGETRDRDICPENVERALAVANQLAQAIVNERLQTAERQHLKKLTVLSEVSRVATAHRDRGKILTHCLRIFVDGFDLSWGIAYLRPREGEALQPLRDTIQKGSALPTEADLERARILAEDAASSRLPRVGEPSEEGGTHTFALPLPAPTGIEAVLILGSSGPLAGTARRTLEAASPELGVALQNARLFAEAERRVEELRLLWEVGQTITSTLALEPVLSASAEVVVRLVDASQAFIFLYDEEKQELRGVATSREDWKEGFRELRLGIDSRSLAAECIRKRRVIQAEDASRSPSAHQELVAYYGHQSLMAVPLLIQNEPVGSLLVGDTRGARRWTQEEIERVDLIAHQIAIATSNARLVEDLRSSYAELGRAQEALVKRERLAALGELSAMVAHEVRNPLGAIFNSLASLRRLLRPAGDAALLFGIVEEEADRLNRIVSDLLDFSRPHEAKLERRSLSALVEEQLHSLPEAEGVVVACEIEDDLPKVEIDADMVRQAVLNLQLNALQSMPTGGRLTVELKRVREGDEAFVSLCIRDTGEGIPPELADKVFQPFFSTKASGTGLGLAVVRRVMDVHRGSIRIQSRPKEGTTFTLLFPIDEDSQ